MLISCKRDEVWFDRVCRVKIGLREFDDEKIVSNLDAVARALVFKKPESIKGKYFLRGYVKSSMGPPVKLDLSQYQALAMSGG